MSTPLVEARAHWGAIVALGEAAVAFHRAHEFLLAGQRNSEAAAIMQALAEPTFVLMRGLGREFRLLGAQSPDCRVREFIDDMLTSLHGSPTWPVADGFAARELQHVADGA